ncbi:hypothetical protein [Longitalea luteola]|uniref:hypothetical protein n=1 Tax=Longitalea luteola TaxID=2812563 RepID=UPI001A972075|nr:hypothetical protein [Longitalea luteola]
MEDKKIKQEGLKEQVHSEFETSVGNDFNVVREETPKKLDENDKGTALNQLPNEDNAKNEQKQGGEPPKMNAPEEG